MTCAPRAATGSVAGAPRHPQQQQPRRHRQRQQARPQQRRAAACAAAQPPRVTLYDAYDRLVPYEQAWQLQKDLVEEVCASSPSTSSSGSSGSSGGGGGSSDGPCTTSSNGSSAAAPPLGALLLLQHPPVYTLGAGATEGHLRFDPAAPPHPLYRTERGGEVTYHGPGQLVMYPILDLRRPPLQPDLHWYLRRLEEVVIRALDAVSGLQGERIPGLTGVWVGGQKVAALGVRASRWVTYHGLALNVAPDLAPFGHIVPCGISDKPVASVQGLLEAAAAEQRRASEEGWADPLAAGFAPTAVPAAASQLAAVAAALGQQQQQQQAAVTGGARGAAAAVAVAGQAAQPPDSLQAEQLIEEYRHSLLDAFQDVFGVQLEAAEGGGSARLAAGR